MNHTDKVWDCIKVIEMPIQQADHIEKLLIQILLPKYNSDSNSRKLRRQIEKKESDINKMIQNLTNENRQD